MFKNILIATVLAVMISIAPTMASESLAKDVIVGRVLALRGTATATHEGANSAASLKKGDMVFLHDRLVTGEDSKLKIVFEDESICTMSKNAELFVGEFVLDESANVRKSVVKLAKGSVKSIISKSFKGAGSAFEVHTRTAVAGAKGTSNIVSDLGDEGDHDSFIIGLDGTTFGRNGDPNVPGEEDLTGGLGTYVDEGQPPSPPFHVPDSLLDPLFSATDIGDDQGGNGGGGNGGGEGEGNGNGGNGGGGGGGEGGGGGDDGGLNGLKADMNGALDGENPLGGEGPGQLGGALDSFGSLGDQPPGGGGDVLPPAVLDNPILDQLALINEGFETSIVGREWIGENAYDISGSYLSIAPPEGLAMGVVHNGGEAKFGYLLQYLNLAQATTLNISFAYNFTTAESLGSSWNDNFMAFITTPCQNQVLVYEDVRSGLTAIPPVTTILANEGGALPSGAAPQAVVPGLGVQASQTGWRNFNTNISMPAGSATFGFTVRDWGDTEVDSAVFLDKVKVTDVGSGVSAPYIGTLTPAGITPAAPVIFQGGIPVVDNGNF